MQAMILAAGMGKRLGDYTKDRTKCLVEVADRPILDHALTALRNIGIKKLILVVGYQAKGVIEFAEKFGEFDITVVENKDYAVTNNIHSLYLAREHLTKDDTIIMESDIIFDESVLKRLVESEVADLAVVDKYRFWMDGTTVLIDDDENIIKFIKKKDLEFHNVHECYKTVNIYKLSKSFSKDHYVPTLEEYITSRGNGQYYELVLRVLAEAPSTRLKALKINDEKWFEIDNPADLNIASGMFCGSEDTEAVTGRYGGFWNFKGLLDFCYLVNPFFPPKMMLTEFGMMLPELMTQYPSGMDVQCLNASLIFDVEPEKLVVGNGAAELINALDGLIGRKIAVCVPTFNEYIRCFRNSEIEKLDMSIHGFVPDVQHLMDALDRNDALVLVSPDNPSGAVLPMDDVIAILEISRKTGKTIIFDESFIDFADPKNGYSLLDDDILEKYPNLLVIKSISKSYGVPGVRLGILASSDIHIIKKIRNSLSIWNINSFGEFFLQIMNKYQKDYRDACELFRNERSLFVSKLSSINGLKVYPSQANYVLCHLDLVKADDLVVALMKDHDILIKDLTGKNGIPDDKFVRIAVRGRSDNDRLVKAVKSIMANRNKQKRGTGLV